MLIIVIVFLIALAIFLISLTFRLLRKPIGWIFKLLIHAAMGYIALFIFNFVGAWVGLSLGLNWVNAIVTGVLGVPGVVLLLLIKYILML